MSKTFRTFLLVLAAFGQILQFFTKTDAQDISTTVTVDSATPNVVKVEGKFFRGQGAGLGRNLSFLRDYAGIANLGERVSAVIPIGERNITGSESIDWAALLKTAGIEAALKDQVTTLTVVAKPSGRQKDLLDKLGYNNWRKLTSK
ncbi:MAG: hypothetical protein ABIO36_04120, partial [Pyrinomonadaceae bacterium]